MKNNVIILTIYGSLRKNIKLSSGKNKQVLGLITRRVKLYQQYTGYLRTIFGKVDYTFTINGSTFSLENYP